MSNVIPFPTDPQPEIMRLAGVVHEMSSRDMTRANVEALRQNVAALAAAIEVVQCWG